MSLGDPESHKPTLPPRLHSHRPTPHGSTRWNPPARPLSLAVPLLRRGRLDTAAAVVADRIGKHVACAYCRCHLGRCHCGLLVASLEQTQACSNSCLIPSGVSMRAWYQLCQHEVGTTHTRSPTKSPCAAYRVHWREGGPGHQLIVSIITHFEDWPGSHPDTFRKLHVTIRPVQVERFGDTHHDV